MWKSSIKLIKYQAQATSLMSILSKYRVLNHLHVFLKASNSELGPYIGDLLREVFSGGPSITLAVKEEHIYSIMNLVFLNRGEKCTSVNMSIINALFELLLVSSYLR